MSGARADRPTIRPVVLQRILLGALAATQTVIGGWALLAPEAFYSGFPAAGHAWVALLPPYNEHLVRDVGALSLATAVMLIVAAVTADRRVGATAVGAYAAYSLPHTVFHGLHLDGFSTADAIAQMGGFFLQIGVILVLAWLLRRGGDTPAAPAGPDRPTRSRRG